MIDPQIRDLDSASATEISLIAQRMRDTLVEIEGPERGQGMYSLEWLEARVRWHLDPATARARVLVAIDASGTIVGHTIFRVEGSDGSRYGLVSTTYVVPAARRMGIAQELLDRAEQWFALEGLDQCCTWTSSGNFPFRSLYTRNGYREVDAGPNNLTGTAMIKLGKSLAAPPVA